MDALMSKREVLKTVGLSYPTIWSRMRKGQFPRSVVVGKGAAAKVMWRKSEIEAWLESLPRQRLKGDPPVRHRKRKRLRDVTAARR